MGGHLGLETQNLQVTVRIFFKQAPEWAVLFWLFVAFIGNLIV